MPRPYHYSVATRHGGSRPGDAMAYLLPAAPAGQLDAQLARVLSHETLHASSVHLPTHVTFAASQLVTQVSPPRPCWLTVGSSTFAVQPHAAERPAARAM